jgi:O-antigen ligase
MAIIGLVLALLLAPLFLRWHHPLLIFAWNANITIFFLPGKPALWMLFAGISFGITVLGCVLEKRLNFQHVPSVTWSLLFLLAVVIVTAKLTGGIGLRALGSATYGGKKFVFIVAGVIGYFALSSQRIDPSRAQTFASTYLLSGLTAVMANLVYLAGPAFYFLYIMFPVDNAIEQAMEDRSLIAFDPRLNRLPGVGAAGVAAINFLLMRYGIRGFLDMGKPWRLVVFVLLMGVSLLGGFRSIVLMLGLGFVIQFYFEGLFRTRFVVVLLLVTALGSALLVPLTKHLPVPVQRSLSFLPVEIAPHVRASAQGSLEWRFEMWSVLAMQIPQYFWVGKGYAIDPSDLYLVEQSVRRGLARSYEVSLVSGDYHSGPLSILIPFGIFGFVAFMWFLCACIRLLYRNYLFSDNSLKNINTFLLSYFLARTVYYFVGFGAMNTDLIFFAGVAGLSVAINGGMRKAAAAPEDAPTPAASLQSA